MIYNIDKDLSSVTGVPKNTLNKIFSKSASIISHNLLETLNKGENTLTIDIGIGTLSLNYFDDILKYKFEPSYRLEKILIDTVTSNKDYLMEEAEESIREKINNSYKDLF